VLAVDPTGHDFGPIAVGGMSDEFMFTITNKGGAPSGTFTPALSDTTNFHISSTTCTSALDPSGSCMVGVRFTPTAVGLLQATAMLTAQPGGTVMAALEGTGTTTITVTPAGGGSGTVTSTPAGIDCGATCMASFSTTSVKLTATPSANSTFDGWMGGGCSGTGDCTVTLTGPTTVTPTFSLKPAALDLQPTSTIFGNVVIGTSSPVADFTVTNTGGAMTGSIDVFVSDSANYFVSGSCQGAILAGGGTCDIMIIFTPTGSAGGRDALLTVSATPGGEQQANLFATAVCVPQGGTCSMTQNCCPGFNCISNQCFSD
jgi:hypothetical protein